MSMEKLLGTELGRGGYGTVYIKKDDDSLCIKVSNKKGNICRQWSNEYKKIIKFTQKLESNDLYKKLKFVKIVKPIEFVESNEQCYMVLPRIFRPEGKNIIKPTIQALFGQISSDVIMKGRGELLGLKEIKEIVNNDNNITDMIQELGIMMALIHFVGKNDAYDVELYLGKESNSKKCRLYLADFDLSEEIKKYDDETIKRITWSLDAVPYFPTEDSNEELFKIFKNAYKSVVENIINSKNNSTIDNINVVEQIFENYG